MITVWLCSQRIQRDFISWKEVHSLPILYFNQLVRRFVCQSTKQPVLLSWQSSLVSSWRRELLIKTSSRLTKSSVVTVVGRLRTLTTSECLPSPLTSWRGGTSPCSAPLWWCQWRNSGTPRALSSKLYHSLEEAVKVWETGEGRPAGIQVTSGGSVCVLSVELRLVGCLSRKTRRTGNQPTVTFTPEGNRRRTGDERWRNWRPSL